MIKLVAIRTFDPCYGFKVIKTGQSVSIHLREYELLLERRIALATLVDDANCTVGTASLFELDHNFKEELSNA